MSISDLGRLIGGADGSVGAADKEACRTAIAFAFDSGYVDAFKVMIYSMYKARTLLNCPVFVITDDAGVGSDEFVKVVADRVIVIDDETRGVLYNLAEHNVGRPARAKWNKGTCLKWACFADYGVDQLLFLDVDMLCLTPVEGLLELERDADLVGCPQFQRTMVIRDKQYMSPEEVRPLIEAMVSDENTKYANRLNSGVMVIRKPLLRQDFFNTLIAFCSQRTEVNEQSHLTSFFRDPENRSRYRMKLVSSIYNFHESYLGLIDRVDAFEILKKIRILHYPGSPKPWDAEIGAKSRLTLSLWWQYRLSAERAGIPFA
jgi:lipopolysaccharide biosynthesis glycosyltransferase